MALALNNPQGIEIWTYDQMVCAQTRIGSRERET